MFGMIGDLTKAVVGAVVETPLAVAADVLTLGGSITDKDEPYLARRVAASSEVGCPRRLDVRRAREVITETTLDRALTHRYYSIVDGLLDLVTMFAKSSAIYRDEMKAQVKQFGVRSAVV